MRPKRTGSTAQPDGTGSCIASSGERASGPDGLVQGEIFLERTQEQVGVGSGATPHASRWTRCKMDLFDGEDGSDRGGACDAVGGDREWLEVHMGSGRCSSHRIHAWANSVDYRDCIAGV